MIGRLSFIVTTFVKKYKGEKMKSTNPNQSPFPMSFSGDNTLFVPKGGSMLSAVSSIIGVLNSNGKTIVITDSYLFKSNNTNANYTSELVQILTSLKAKKIVFVSDQGWGDTAIRSTVENALSSNGCSFEYHSNKYIHDRWWICVEEKVGIDMNSLNGIGNRACTLLQLPQVDVDDILKDLAQKGVLQIATTSK